ncbi:MASE3 domain-containing protein [Desulfobacterales bacterium HSG17]|nr:MASE3 domain-containing protein [Desulfobacterales bacterium HSG17]
MLKYSMPVISGLLIFTGFYYISINNYLLFHSLTELFSVVIGTGIFMMVCVAYKFMENPFVLIIGVAYLFIGILDVLHIFAYKGMGVFPAFDANLPTQLWIQARLLESLSICLALYILKEKSKFIFKIVFTAYPIIFCLLIFMTLSGFFPDCYIEGSGLTSFKKLCEYLVSMILLIAVLMLQKRQHMFDPTVIKLLYASIFIKIGSELAFTFYISVYGFSNFTGHILKGISFYLIYRAVIKTGIENPYLMLRQTQKEWKTIFQAIGHPTFILDKNYNILEINKAASELVGLFDNKLKTFKCYEVFHNSTQVIQGCPMEIMINSGHFNKSIEKEISALNRTFLVSCTPVLDEHGDILKIIHIARDITERKKAEAAIYENEKHLLKAQEIAQIGSWKLDIQTGKVWGSDELFEVFGLNSDESAFDVFLEVVHPDDREFVAHTMQTAKEVKGSYSIEHRLLCHDGREKIIHAIGEVLPGNNNRFEIMIGSVQDITERKISENKLRRTNELLENLYETTHFSIVYLDRDFNFIRVNKAYADACAHPPEFFTGKNHFDLYPHDENKAIFRSVVETREPVTFFAKAFEFPDHPEWGVTYWDWSLHPIKDKAGEVEALIFALVDVTKTKLAELELKLHHDRLEELVEKRTHELGERVKELNCLYNISRLFQNTQMPNDEFFQEIVNIISSSWQYPDAVCARIIFQNQEFKTNDFIVTEWRQACDIIIDECPEGMVEVFYKEKKPESDEGPFLKEERSLISSIAEQLGNIIVFKRAEDALKRAKETAETANRAKTLFLANMNHELRTPLNSILGFAQILHNDSSIPIKQRENIHIMLQSGEHLLNLINDILDMAKIESGRITLNESLFHLSELLDTIKEMIHYRLENKNVELIIEPGPNLPEIIKTDEGKLRQILINLLGNAVKFTEKGNITLKIGHAGKIQRPDKFDKFDEFDESENIRLNFEIKDTGSGIPKKDMDFIFEAFNQSHDLKSKPEGTGLGLTISREFVQLMGGGYQRKQPYGSWDNI